MMDLFFSFTYILHESLTLDPGREIKYVLPRRRARAALLGGEHDQPAARALLSRASLAGV